MRARVGVIVLGIIVIWGHRLALACHPAKLALPPFRWQWTSLLSVVRARDARSDFEISGLRDPTLDAGAMRPGAQLVQSERIEPLHRLFLQFEP